MPLEHLHSLIHRRSQAWRLMLRMEALQGALCGFWGDTSEKGDCGGGKTRSLQKVSYWGGKEAAFWRGEEGSGRNNGEERERGTCRECQCLGVQDDV